MLSCPRAVREVPEEQLAGTEEASPLACVASHIWKQTKAMAQFKSQPAHQVWFPFVGISFPELMVTRMGSW